MRISYWDKWKGAAILAVVLIHALGSTANFPPDSFNNELGIILRQFINFPVGLFIFLAAFFASKSKGSNLSYYQNVKKRVLRLVLPFLLWSIIYFGVRIFRGNLELTNVPLMLINGTSVSVGYFVIVMIQMSLISPFLERLKTHQLIQLLSLSFFVSICATYTLNFILPENIWSKFPYYPLPFIIWLPFYIGGLIFGKKGETCWQSLKVSPIVGAYIVCVGLSLIEALWILEDLRSLATSQLKMTSMLTTGTVCVLVLASWSYSKDKKENFLSWLGQRSYYFYLSHMLVLLKVKYFFAKFSIIYNNQILFVLIITLATLLITAIGALILDKVLSQHQSFRRVIGLA
ncbi:acyltransferase [Paraglaciecola chathamensis]|uniref:Acyltransferase 3 domain-containing protein n=1 Tax=Paraglaciecola chathamensis S18K6 TaxID=1127672 RepID=A0AAV3V6P0_9ALTE|nr:acyltransferase [Paraglaciecola chathamensis]GAC12377.1 hypothetical protein GCHA_4459 [Paraglaciecola chathamensis S18K6]